MNPDEESVERPPNLRDIARESGLSLATVSLALRDSAAINVRTRERVKEVARSMGYQANPLAAAFHSEIRRRGKPNFRATIAWINDYQEQDRWDGHPILVAAAQRAHDLGYVLDVVHVDAMLHPDEPELLIGKFVRVMQARGIHAAILPELHRSSLTSRPWPDVAVVLVGHFEGFVRYRPENHPGRALYHRVGADIAWNTMEALRVLKERGAAKIGYVCTEWQNAAHDEAALGAWLARQAQEPARLRLPALILKTVSRPEDRESFKVWFERHRPDALLFENHEILDWLKRMKVKVPQQLRVAHLALHDEGGGVSGIDECPERQGEAVVDLLTSHLQRNERRVPDFPKSMWVPGRWRDGGTA